MKIIDRKTSEIIPYEKNPRINNNAIDKTAISIKEFGFQQPIVVDPAGVVIAGHTRLKAAIKLKLETCPVIVAEGLTDAQVKAYRIADNRTGELATWDDELLAVEIQDLIDMKYDIELTGFDPEDFGIGIDEIRFPNLPSGDKEPFQQMTFTLADAQAELIQESIRKIKKNGIDAETFGNQNSNGNALYNMVVEWAEQKK